MLMLLAFLLVIGCFMDNITSMTILTPIFVSIVTGLGFTLTHFGVFMTVALAIGFVTPPYGANLFVASGITGLPVMAISKKIFPMIGVLILYLLIITFVPQLTLWLYEIQLSWKGLPHGAYPWEERSALDAGMLFGMSLEMLREHIKPNGPDAANTINYTFQDCGPTFANVVPEITTVQLYGRFADIETSRDAFKRVKDCAQGAALATGTTSDCELITYTHNKIPNKTLAEVVHRNMEHYGAPAFTPEEQEFTKKMQTYMCVEPSGLDTKIQPFGPSETIICGTSEFSWNAPYVTFWVTLGLQGVGWYNWMVTACAGSSISKKTMSRTGQIMTSSFIDIVTSPETVAKAREEWKERMAGRTYECLLPAEHPAPLGINRSIMERYSCLTNFDSLRVQRIAVLCLSEEPRIKK